MLAHIAGIPVEEALLAAPALLAGLTMIAGYVRAAAAHMGRSLPDAGVDAVEAGPDALSEQRESIEQQFPI